jgi:histone H3/H4
MAISEQAAKKILKGAGAARVSDSASRELAEMMNSMAYALAKKAVKLAKHAGRKTVQKSDVDLAK